MADGPPRSGRNRRVHAGPGDARRPPPPTPGRPAAAPQSASAPAGDSLSAAHSSHVLNGIVDKVGQLAERAARIDASLHQHASSTAEAERRRVAEQRDAAAQARSAAEDQARRTIADRRHELDQELADFAETASPAAWSAPFDQPLPTATVQQLGAADLIRRGSMPGGPALYPLFHDKGWYLTGPAQQTFEEIQNAVVRAVASLPLPHLRIDVFDPRIEGRMGFLAPLRSASASSFAPPATSGAAFRTLLESVAATAAENAEAIAAAQVRDLGQLWRSNGIATGTYRILVVLNYPDGFERDTHELLVRLARSGGRNGIAVLVQVDPSVTAADGVRTDQLKAVLRPSRIEADGRLLLDEYPERADVGHDGPMPTHLVTAALSAAADRTASDSGPLVPLSELIADDAATPWRHRSLDGIETPIGRRGTAPIGLALRSQNPPISNMLIGGAVGQGKSNLLLDLIYGLAARYDPDELELFLLDFKRGLEFNRFAADDTGKNWLPHARVLSLESDRPFGVAALRHMSAELERRSRLFKHEGASGLEDYRNTTGLPLSRILLVIDEFQVLFDGDDELTDEAVELLETIARQGRASGVHMVLSSQTTTGVRGLRVKGESIFAQFPVRISLKNTTTESEAILSQGNKAAADLTYRGEVIINRNFGNDPGSNERAICAFAEPEFIDVLQRRLWELRPTTPPPTVLVASEFGPAPTRMPPLPAPGAAAVGWIGREVDVTDELSTVEVDDDVDQTIAVVGADDNMATVATENLLATLGRTLRPERVMVVDLTAPTADIAAASLEHTLASLADDGVVVDRIGRAEALDRFIRPMRAQLATDDAPRTLVVGLGWQRWTGLDDYQPVDPDDDEAYDTFTIRDVLTELTQRGALRSQYLIARWTTLRSLQDQLDHYYSGVRHFVMAKLNVDDYHAITSPTARPIEGSPRLGHLDRASDRGVVTVVPYRSERSAR